MRYMFFSAWVLSLTLVLSGCATNHPMVSTCRNPQFSPSVTNTLALTVRPNPNPADEELGRMVTAELQRAGFKLVPAAQADYFLAYVLGENSEELVWMDRQPVSPMMIMPPMSSTPQTTRQIIRRSTAPPTVSVFRVTQYRTKEIWLYLYTNPEKTPGGLQVAWQGTITVGKSASPERELVLLKTLLHYWGQDHDGRVELVH